MPAAELKDWAQDNLPGSFRNPPAIRAHLRSIINSQATLQPWLIDLLASHLVIRQTISALSGEALAFNAAILSTLYGGNAFALGLLLDQREEMKEMGRKLLEKPIEELDGGVAEDEWAGFIEDAFLYLTRASLTWPEPLGKSGGPQQEIPGESDRWVSTKLAKEFVPEK